MNYSKTGISLFHASETNSLRFVLYMKCNKKPMQTANKVKYQHTVNDRKHKLKQVGNEKPARLMMFLEQSNLEFWGDGRNL